MGELVKVRLLNNGGYHGMSGVKFPVDVVGKVGTYHSLALVDYSELERIGCDMVEFIRTDGAKDNWSFWIDKSCEIIND